jgi:hypothetical protein
LSKKILGIVVFLMAVAVLASPALAIGPTNIPENKNPNLISEGIHTQIWLPSGVMNEWIDAPGIGELKVTIKDAAKFQITTAIPLSMPDDIVIYASTDNQWFYLTQNDFATFLLITGGNPAVADPYEAGIYIMGNLLG